MAATPNIDAAVPSGARIQRSRTTLAVLGWTFGSVKSLLTMAVAFVATPYLLYYLGAERLGALRAAQQWTGFLVYFYFALNPALGILLLQAISHGKTGEASALIKTGVRLEMRQMLLYVAPAAAAMAWFMPILVPVDAHLRNELRIGAFVFLLSLPFTPSDVFRTFLECSQNGYLVHLALLAQAVLIQVGGVWLAWCGYGLIGQFAAFDAGAIAFAAIVIGFALFRLPGFRAARPAAIRRDELWSLQWPMAIAGVGNQINLLTDYIVAGLILGSNAVTTFLLTQRLVTTLGGFVTSLTTASWAGLAEVIATEDRAMVQARALELLRLVMGLSVTLLGTLAAYNFQFVSLWVGHDYYGGELLTVLTAVQVLMVAFIALFYWTIDLHGGARDRVSVSSIGALLNVGLSFILARLIGLYGITLATIIGYGVSELWYDPYLFCRRYGVSLRAVAVATATSLAQGVPWISAVWMIAHRQRQASGWSSFGLELAVMIVVGTIYAWLLILNRSDRKLWGERVRRILVSKSAQR